MGIEITIDTSGLDAMAAKVDGNALNLALTERVLEDDLPQVPYRTGHLHDSGEVSAPDEIQYTEHYAGYVYNGTSKMAANPWFEKTKGAHLGDWEQFVANQITGA